MQFLPRDSIERRPSPEADRFYEMAAVFLKVSHVGGVVFVAVDLMACPQAKVGGVGCEM